MRIRSSAQPAIITHSILGAALLASQIVSPSVARAEVWQIARGPSSVEFAVGHLIFTEVKGRFSRFSGTVDCPGDDFTGAKVQVSIDVTSVNTRHTDRDRELLTEDFFAAERFPEMRFESRFVEQTGQKTYRLIGDLTIRGITREVELAVRYRGERRTAHGKRRDFRATGSINRSGYGMLWNDLWAGRALVGEKVAITLTIALVEKPG